MTTPTAGPRENTRSQDQDSGHQNALEETMENRVKNGTFPDNIHHKVTIIESYETEKNSTFHHQDFTKSNDLHASHGNASTLAPPYTGNQTVTQNHDPLLGKVIKFDVCAPCGGSGMDIII